MAETAEIPQPTFPHRAYGVDLAPIGDEGGMAARGHVPGLRFLAACNHYGRSIGLRNATDDEREQAADWLLNVKHVWAVPEMPDEGEWYVRWGDVTKDTPGAIPMTVWEP